MADILSQNSISSINIGDLVKRGLAKATDASAFHGLGKKIKVTYRNEDFDVPEMKPQLLDKEK